MTPLLEQALDKVRKLPAYKQDDIATMILEELAAEGRWNESFAASQEPLAQLAEKVRQDISAGRVRRKGMDQV